MKEVKTYFCRVCNKSLFGSGYKVEGVCSVACLNNLKWNVPFPVKFGECLICGKSLIKSQRKFCSKVCAGKNPERIKKRNCSSPSRMNSCGKYRKE